MIVHTLAFMMRCYGWLNQQVRQLTCPQLKKKGPRSHLFRAKIQVLYLYINADPQIYTQCVFIQHCSFHSLLCKRVQNKESPTVSSCDQDVIFSTHPLSPHLLRGISYRSQNHRLSLIGVTLASLAWSRSSTVDAVLMCVHTWPTQVQLHHMSLSTQDLWWSSTKCFVLTPCQSSELWIESGVGEMEYRQLQREPKTTITIVNLLTLI